MIPEAHKRHAKHVVTCVVSGQVIDWPLVTDDILFDFRDDIASLPSRPGAVLRSGIHQLLM